MHKHLQYQISSFYPLPVKENKCWSDSADCEDGIGQNAARLVVPSISPFLWEGRLTAEGLRQICLPLSSQTNLLPKNNKDDRINFYCSFIHITLACQSLVGSLFQNAASWCGIDFTIGRKTFKQILSHTVSVVVRSSLVFVNAGSSLRVYNVILSQKYTIWLMLSNRHNLSLVSRIFLKQILCKVGPMTWCIFFNLNN